MQYHGKLILIMSSLWSEAGGNVAKDTQLFVLLREFDYLSTMSWTKSLSKWIPISNLYEFLQWLLVLTLIVFVLILLLALLID